MTKFKYILIINIVSYVYFYILQLIICCFFNIKTDFTPSVGIIIFLIFSNAYALLYGGISTYLLKKQLSIKYIDENSKTIIEKDIYQRIKKYSDRAEIKTPLIGIVDQQEFNAFVFGFFKRKKTIVLTKSLIHNLLDKDPLILDSIIAHEIGHIKNDDTFVSNFLSGFLNANLLLIPDLVQFYEAITNKKLYISFFVHVLLTPYFVYNFITNVINETIILAHSRSKEYSADLFSAKLIGSILPLSQALYLLSQSSKQTLPSNIKTQKTFNKSDFELFSTHPKIKNRIFFLQKHL